MVFHVPLLHVYLKLVKIFGCTNNTPFADITVTAVGDFMQLPSVKARPVYIEYENSRQNFVPIWEPFKIAQLIEVMRQHGERQFIDLLNH